MSRALFITGTGTDIGKTYVTGLIVKKLAEHKKNPGYYKAAMSGNARRPDGSLIPGDALFVQQCSGISQPLEDIVKELNLPSVIIADAGLVTINSVVLTAEYMKANHMPVKGIIFNHFHPGNVMEEDNIFMCEYMTRLPALAKVTDQATDLDIDIDLLTSLYEQEDAS